MTIHPETAMSLLASHNLARFKVVLIVSNYVYFEKEH